MRRLGIALAVLAGLAAAGWGGLQLWADWYFERAQDPAFFADEIAAFAEQDRARPPPERPIVFVGSSSVRLWSTLAEDMAPLPVINRGFGGSQLASVNHWIEETVLRYRPRAVVLYAGDNDLDERTKKTAADVVRDFQSFVARVHETVPDARIYFLAIKPSKQRWARWPEQSKANQAIAALCAADPRLAYLDVATPLLGPDGAPRDDVLLFDGLHLNATGYAAWTQVVRPRLVADFGGAER